MKYYYCEDCKAIFSEEEVTVIVNENRHWWLDDCPIETWTEYECPECGSSYIEECEYCDMCGEPCMPDTLIDGLCEKCKKEEAANGVEDR
jgi:hypothetical protein